MRKFGVAATVVFVLLLVFMVWKENGLLRDHLSRSRFWSKLGFGKNSDGETPMLPLKRSTQQGYGENLLAADICEGVETFIMFIGYPRSGHSLIGSLIDAHPHAIIAHEFDLVGHWKAWDSRQKNKYYLFSQLYKNSQSQVLESKGFRNGNRRHLFDYSVPNQWQGKFKDVIKVIGDKKGGKTTVQLAKQKRRKILLNIQKVIGIPVKYLHVIRNPFDNISTMLLRTMKLRNVMSGLKKPVNNSKGLEWEIRRYFNLVAKNNELRMRFANDILDIHSVDIINNSKNSLLRICQFLRLTCDEQFISDCTDIIFPEQSKTRDYVHWTETQKKEVQEQLGRYAFLKNYSFTS